ncbi:MAG: glycosyltransferase [Alphaproteobacteria bacterium]|nr:glycosyltransferase [Alphaproteobacteria bacterium SS10]
MAGKRRKSKPHGRFLVVDTELQTKIGHNFNATSRVARAAIDFGFDQVVIGCNRHFSAAPAAALDVEGTNIDVVPGFSSQAYDLFTDQSFSPSLNANSIHYGVYNAKALYAELSGFLDQVEATSQDLLYFHTFSLATAEAVLRLLRNRAPAQTPTIHALVYMKPHLLQLSEVKQSKFPGILDRFAAEGFLDTKIFFHVETKRLQQAYAELGFDFPVLFGPISTPAAVTDAKSRKKEAKQRQVAFLGEARAEKGFWILAEIINIFAHRYPGMLKKTKFVIQCEANGDNQAHPWVQESIDRLKRIAKLHDNISLISSVEKSEYEALIAESDIILLPYDLEAYECRGSGVAYEALAYGQSLIVPADTDIDVSFDFPNVIAADNYCPETFAERIYDAVKMPQSQWLEASKEAIAYIEQFNGPGFISRLVDGAKTRSAAAKKAEAKRSAPKKRALLLCCGTLDGGVGMVQKAQLSALCDLGIDVDCVFLPWSLSTIQSSFEEAEFYNSIDNRRDEFDIPEGAGIIAYTPYVLSKTSVDAERIIMTLNDRVNVNSFESFEYRTTLIDPDYYAEFIRDQEYDWAIVNYPFYIGALDLLGAKYKKLIVETHDLQAKQMYFRRLSAGRPEDTDKYIEKDYRDELAASGQADALVHISEQLQSNYAGVPDSVKQTTIRPCVPKAQIEKCRELSQAAHRISDVGQLTSYLTIESPEAGHALPEWMTNSGASGLDLAFIGSSHFSNVASLRWFIDSVYLPILRPLGVNFSVAGSICADLGDYGDQLWRLGRVRDAEPLQLAARVNVLAVENGTGFPTKVIETLSLGQAFSASAYGFYELADQAAKYFPVLDAIDDWADDILEQLLLRPARSIRGKDGRRFASKHFSPANYRNSWAKVLGHRKAMPKGFDEDFYQGTGHAEVNLEQRIPLLNQELLKRLPPNRLRRLQRRNPVLKRLTGAVKDHRIDNWVDGVVEDLSRSTDKGAGQK